MSVKDDTSNPVPVQCNIIQFHMIPYNAVHFYALEHNSMHLVWKSTLLIHFDGSLDCASLNWRQITVSSWGCFYLAIAIANLYLGLQYVVWKFPLICLGGAIVELSSFPLWLILHFLPETLCFKHITYDSVWLHHNRFPPWTLWWLIRPHQLHVVLISRIESYNGQPIRLIWLQWMALIVGNVGFKHNCKSTR